ncbi:MAG: anthranilate synthase component I, partial [Desulfobacteraceae bacterium Eth-SRB1]
MITLSKNEFLNKMNKKNGLVQVATLLDTKLVPSEVYAILKSHDSTGYSYLLESVEKEKRHARFSFVGASPLAVITIKNRKIVINFFIKTAVIDDVKANVGQVCEKITYSNNAIVGDIADGYDVFDALRAAILIDKIVHEDMVFSRQVFSGGAIGFVAYDCVYDSHIDLQPFYSETPDAQFVLTTKTILFDHLTKKTHLIFTEHITEDSNLKAIYENIVFEVSNIEHLLSRTKTIPESVSHHNVHVVGCTADKVGFEQIVERAKQHIIDGDILQVVPSRRCELETRQSAYQLYQQLRKVNPSPYMYLFEFKDTAIIGASPETLLSVHNRKVVTNPIAGTCPRGSTP